jgi:ketosteroid isomerase-like protein
MKLTTLTQLILPVLGHQGITTGITTGINLYVNATKGSPSLTQKATARTFIDAYNAWDIEAIMDYRTPECLQQVLPSSMGKPAKNNTEYRTYFESIMPLFSNFTVKVHKELHDIEARTSLIHASSRADTAVGRYANEYALILSFTKDRTKVTKIEEFVDSAYTTQFFAKLTIPASKTQL